MATFLDRRWLIALLIFSAVIRCLGLSRPLLDAHNIRQVHTAVLAKNLVEDGFPFLPTRGDWKGFENSTVVLELPVQMHLAARLAPLVGSLEAAGRLTAIAAWIAAFLLFCWLSRRLLSPFAASVAVVCFAFSPLSIFFGQSFQPETWVLFLSLAVLAAFLKWCDDERPIWLVAMAAALMLGFTLKSNEMLHLAIPLAAVGWSRKGGGILLRWQLWIVALAAVATLIVWSKVITHYNRQSFPGWSSAELLRGFVGTLDDRLRPRLYAKLAGYMGLLGLTPMLVAFWCAGLWTEGRTRRDPLILGWGAGLVIYYLVFGPGGPGEHSYYHLVALPWFCLVAAIGVEAALSSGRFGSRSPLMRSLVVLLWVGGAVLGTAHLYRPDRIAWKAARALAALNPSVEEGVLVAADHSPFTSGFGLYPTIFFYSGTRGYNLPAACRIETIDALLGAHPELTWVIQTINPTRGEISWRDRIPFFAQRALPQLPLDEPLLVRGFTKVGAAPAWNIFHRAQR